MGSGRSRGTWDYIRFPSLSGGKNYKRPFEVKNKKKKIVLSFPLKLTKVVGCWGGGCPGPEQGCFFTQCPTPCDVSTLS